MGTSKRTDHSRKRGCDHLACPQANWSTPDLPRWQICIGGHLLGVLAACDATCATHGGEVLAMRLGYPPSARLALSVRPTEPGLPSTVLER